MHCDRLPSSAAAAVLADRQLRADLPETSLTGGTENTVPTNNSVGDAREGQRKCGDSDRLRYLGEAFSWLPESG